MTLRENALRQRNPVGGKELVQIALEGMSTREAIITTNSWRRGSASRTPRGERECLSRERESLSPGIPLERNSVSDLGSEFRWKRNSGPEVV